MLCNIICQILLWKIAYNRAEFASVHRIHLTLQYQRGEKRKHAKAIQNVIKIKHGLQSLFMYALPNVHGRIHEKIYINDRAQIFFFFLRRRVILAMMVRNFFLRADIYFKNNLKIFIIILIIFSSIERALIASKFNSCKMQIKKPIMNCPILRNNAHLNGMK